MFKVLEAKRLTYKKRKTLKDSDFAYVRTVNGKKKRSYPIYDIAHGRNALSRVSQFGSDKVKAIVRKAVYKRYPGLKERHEARAGKRAYAELMQASQRNFNVFCNLVTAQIPGAQFSCDDNYVFASMNKNTVKVPFFTFCLETTAASKVANRAVKALNAA